MKTIFESYSPEEIERIIQSSTSWKDFARKLGYSHSPSGATVRMLKEKTKQYDTSHFISIASPSEPRTQEDTFVENSTASQSTVRRLYSKLDIPYVCSICGQEPEWQGKPLTLILDHINGINNDDRLENLRWVCPNCNQQLDTTGGKNKRVPAKKYYCPRCGKEMAKGSKLCASCNNLEKIIPLDQMPVTREELKSLIRSYPFTKIGERFGVSDNAIRKWCEKFNLPKKATDIKKITDEEWNLI